MILVYSKIFFETESFFVAIPNPPHIDRKDGGHIVIVSKKFYNAFYEMPDEFSNELIVIAKCCGKALQQTLCSKNIEIGIVNYQINGNWSVHTCDKEPVHMHVYGRAKKSINQIYGEALYFPNPKEGFYDKFTPLTDDEIAEITNYLIINLQNR